MKRHFAKALFLPDYRRRTLDDSAGSRQRVDRVHQQEITDPSVSKPREALVRWQAAKPGQLGAAA